jgi:Flp pilus assembly protein TadD/4-amino-4-deoxy-L-arabinose transferase-like glycosyltransferase
LGLVVAIAAILKWLVVWQLADHPMVQPEVGLDTSAYVDLARRVVAGDLGLGPGLYFVSPLYIYVLAAGLTLTDSFTTIRMLQALAGALAVGGIWVMAREWATPRAALMAAGLAAATGLFTFYEVLILQASIDVALTAAALLMLTWALKNHGARWYVFSGVVFGLASLNRPNMLIAGIGIAAVALVLRRVRPGLLLTAGLLIGMAPVAGRNVVVAGEWSLVSSHGGLNFYIGNSDTATGFYHQIPGISPDITGQARDAKRMAEQALGRALTDAQTSDYFRDLALTWIRTHPADAVALFAKKLGYVFHAQHVALPYSYPFYAYDAGTALRLYAVGPWLLIPLGMIGLVVLIRRATPPDMTNALIWLSFVPLYAVSVALFFVAERYRLPLLVPLCVGSGIALDALASAVTARHWRTLLAPVAIFVVCLGLVNIKTNLSDGRWDEGIRLSQRLVILGRDAEADMWVRRLAPTAPRPGEAHYQVGRQYLAGSQVAKALPYLREAHRLDSARADSGYDLAAALKETGDIAAATSVISRLAPSPSDDAEAWMRIGRLAASIRAPEVAERFFREGARLAPGQPSARLQYGLNLLVLNRISDAARELAEAARLDPRNPDALAHLAYCERSMGRLDDALRHADEALRIDPTNAMALAIRRE